MKKAFTLIELIVVIAIIAILAAIVAPNAFTTNMPIKQKPTDNPYPLVVEFENRCFPNGPNEKCAISEKSGEKIDTLIDDGDFDNGSFRKSPGRFTYFHWVLK